MQPDDLLIHLARDAYDDYQQHKTLSAFLKIVEAVGDRDADGAIEQWWTVAPPQSSSPAREFLVWVARLKPWSDEPGSSRRPGTEDWPAERIEALEASVNFSVTASNDRAAFLTERRRNADNKYGMFWAAYEFPQLLTEVFADADPAVRIGEYLAALFPAETHTLSEDFIKTQAAKCDMRVTPAVARFLHNTVVPWAFAASNQTPEIDVLRNTILPRTLIPLLLNGLDEWAIEPVPRASGRVNAFETT